VVGCCIYEVPGEGSVFGPIPIGRPIANTYLYLLDRHLQPVPVGVPGELYIGGSGLARGYVNRPDLTAERFIANPFSMEAGARLYQSGDMARYRGDGTIEYLGRIDQQVKFRGYRIEPGEIEAVLGQHPAVHESVVVAREDTPGDKRLVAYVVARQLPAPTSGELRSFVAEQLPEYMVPSAFVLLHTLPLTSNGKVDRRQLTTPNGKVDQLVLPVIDQSVEPIIDVQPRDELEFQLLQIWEEVLNVRPISVLDNFFELGGHSILAVRLVSRIHKQFGQDLALAILFQNPTLADLAVVLRRQASPESQSALVKIQPNGSKPPFFSVHPVGGNVFCYLHLARYLGPDQPFYGLQNPGLAGTGEYFSKLEAMAAHYIAAMQTVQPQGPYLLGGWSMGGVVAFEMAQQLQKQGYEVALLAIIDSEPPISYLNPNARVEKPALDDAALAESVLRELNLVPGEDFYLREPEEQLKYALERAKDVNVIPMDTDLGLLRRLMVIRVMNNYVTHLYLPSVYPHRITFFRASESVKAAQDLAHPDEAFTGAYGWENLTTGGIEVHIVPGKHSNLGEEPNVQALAASLSHCIDRVGACRAPNI
jgi:thioesterase domain-containing protein/aryl carrier-like protein